MRYIVKGAVPSFFSDWVNQRKAAGKPLLYEKFRYKRDLNDALRAEQHNICCYCQRTIDHHNEPWVKGSRNEHLYPENIPGDPVSVSKQMDYDNLFACCIDSQGHKKLEKHLRYCDVAKENLIIREFIKEPSCSQYFRYNLLGEIIPNGKLTTWKEYENATGLGQDESDARDCIRILNLNCVTLVADRILCINALVRSMAGKSKDDISAIIDNWQKSSAYPSYFDMRLQLLHKYLSKSSK